MNDQVLKDYEEYKAQGRIWGGVPPERIARIKFPRIDRKTIDEFLALDDLAEPGDILVADFGGNLDVSNMGGQSVAVAQSCGVVGAVVNGAVRDVPSFRSRSFPAWSRGTTPITGKCRMQ